LSPRQTTITKPAAASSRAPTVGAVTTPTAASTTGIAIGTNRDEVEGRGQHAETDWARRRRRRQPLDIRRVLAKKLARYPVHGRRRSLRDAASGYKAASGKPFAATVVKRMIGRHGRSARRSRGSIPIRSPRWQGANSMNDRAKVASAEYETIHMGKSYPCTGTILATGDDFLLRERILVSVDREAFDERSKPLTLREAQKVLQEWIALDIAEVLQIPWD
jgi:hypothetical protein